MFACVHVPIEKCAHLYVYISHRYICMHIHFRCVHACMSVCMSFVLCMYIHTQACMCWHVPVEKRVGRWTKHSEDQLLEDKG